jgi:transposase
MMIIGCDYHPGFQQIAFVDTETGECGERRLTHREEAEQFYGMLKERSVRVGMEASGHARWFERLLSELQFELWIGDAAEIRTKRVRKQKTDRQESITVQISPLHQQSDRECKRLVSPTMICWCRQSM